MTCHEKKPYVRIQSDKCGITGLGAVRVGFLKQHHFSIFLVQKKLAAKDHK